MKPKKSVKSLPVEQQRVIQKIGQKLRSIRVHNGYTSYEDFAHENDINSSQVGKYERGADMRISTLVKITMFLGITIEEFFTGFDND
jgi:transcriptional regulator with XRE-family HTH domain